MQIYKNVVILASSGNLAPYVHPASHPPSIITQDASNRFVTDAEKAAWNAGGGGTAYTHPTNHPPSIITQDASNRFVTDAEKTSWNAKGDPYTHPTSHPPSIITQDAGNRFVTDAEKTTWNSAGNSIGGPQEWSAALARTINTTYTNSTDRPIVVSASFSPFDIAVPFRLVFMVDGVSISTDTLLINGSTGFLSTTQIVPSGSTYNITCPDYVSGTVNAVYLMWRELRV